MTTEDFVKESGSFPRDGAAAYIAENAVRDLDRLKEALAMAKQERRTPSPADFELQLQRLMEAKTALVHQKLLGLGTNSEISKIVSATYHEEFARFKFLVYGDINVTPEQAEAAYQQHLKDAE